jgi:serine/threonine-protein kinase
LELSVTPPVNVSLNGKPLGRTPLTVSLPPGHHMLKLSDSEKGINVTRAVTVNRGGTTHQSVELGKGLLTVHIPEGAVINLDGKTIGNESIRDLSVYEGAHKLVVVSNGAKWQQAFTLAKDQSMEYEVHSEAQR